MYALSTCGLLRLCVSKPLCLSLCVSKPVEIAQPLSVLTPMCMRGSMLESVSTPMCKLYIYVSLCFCFPLYVHVYLCFSLCLCVYVFLRLCVPLYVNVCMCLYACSSLSMPVSVPLYVMRELSVNLNPQP